MAIIKYEPQKDLNRCTKEELIEIIYSQRNSITQAMGLFGQIAGILHLPTPENAQISRRLAMGAIGLRK